MNSLTWPLIHFVWQGALIAVALWLALRFARASRTRYALTAAALLLMALAPFLTYLSASPAAVVPIAEAGASAIRLAPAPATNWLALIPYLWSTGVALFSIRLIRAALAARALRTGASPVANAWPHLVNRAVTILESAHVSVPSQSGIWRPVIFVPLGFLTQLPPDQVEAILAHEMAHIHRHDYLVNLLQVIVETLLFYHPGVWWVSNAMRRERELCADELAASLIADKRSLAHALLTLEETRQSVFAPAANGGHLKHRIERLLASTTPPRGSLLPAVAAVAAVLGFATLRAQEPPRHAPTVVKPTEVNAAATDEFAEIRAKAAEIDKLARALRDGQSQRSIAALEDRIAELGRRLQLMRTLGDRVAIDGDLSAQRALLEKQLAAQQERLARDQQRLEHELTERADGDLARSRQEFDQQQERLAQDQRRFEEDAAKLDERQRALLREELSERQARLARDQEKRKQDLVGRNQREQAQLREELLAQLQRDKALLDKELSGEQARLERHLANLQREHEALSRSRETSVAERLVFQDQALSAAKARLEALRKQYKETHPDVQQLEKDIRNLERLRETSVLETATVHAESAEIAARRGRLQREIDAMRQAGLMTAKLEETYQKAMAEIPQIVQQQLADERSAVEQQVDRGKATRRQRTDEAIRRFSVNGLNGDATPRGKVYVENGPPDQIDKTSEGEIWRYRDGRVFRFQ